MRLLYFSVFRSRVVIEVTRRSISFSFRRHVCHAERVLVNVGANWGGYCLPIAVKNPDITVIAFEPNPNMADHLRRKSRKIPNLVVVEQAVGQESGTATFNLSEGGDGGCSSLLKLSDGYQTRWSGRSDILKTGEITVNVTTLENYIDASSMIDRIDVLVVDAQGMDLSVLKGTGKYLSAISVGVMEAGTETDVLYEGQCTVTESVDFLTSSGFAVLGMKTNDIQCNEVNIYFSRRDLDFSYDLVKLLEV
jgi:FkbM family methyltransferase